MRGGERRAGLPLTATAPITACAPSRLRALIPSPACGGGTRAKLAGRGHDTRMRSWLPPPRPPPQAGEGEERQRLRQP
jgi:hypothetical protein